MLQLLGTHQWRPIGQTTLLDQHYKETEKQTKHTFSTNLIV